jgi:hypothetical protein
MSLRFQTTLHLLLALLFLCSSVLLEPATSYAAPQGSSPRITSIGGVRPGQVLRGRVVIEAKVSGTRPRTVVFQLDGPHRHNHTEYGAPYFFGGGVNGKPKGWDTTRYPDGTYTLRVTATDRGGRKDSETVRFAVNNHLEAQPQPTTPPSFPTTEPKPDDPFAPPVLHNPKTVYLSNSRPSYRGNGKEDVRVVVTEKLTRPAAVRNVRNLVLIGGEFTIGQPIPRPLPRLTQRQMNELAMRHKGLSIADVSGTAYLEGIYINGTNGNMTEGLMTYNTTGKRFPHAKIVVVNSRIEGMRTTLDDVWSKGEADRDERPGSGRLDGQPRFNKSDSIEHLYGSLLLKNVSVIGSDFQGIYATAQHGNSLGEMRAMRVNLRGIRQAAWCINNAKRSGVVWTQADELYNRQDSHSKYPNNKTFPYMYGDRGDGPDIVTASYVRWTKNAKVAKGMTIYFGDPLQGDFAPASKVGRSYDAQFFR